MDIVLDQVQTVDYPTKFLNSLEPSNVPPHRQLLKQVYAIMLLRNLNQLKQCNGIRLKVKNLLP